MSKAAELAALIGSQTALSNRNLLINGAMQVNQRGTETNSDGNDAVADRFLMFRGGTDARFTLSTDTDVPSGQGFTKSAKIDVTTADTSFAAGDLIGFRQQIEGRNVQHLKKGTSNAESLTLSFYIKSSVTGTYILELYDFDNTRQISKSYTVSSANTWEKKTLTFPGDTSGALDNDTNRSLLVHWWLGAGSNYQSGTLNTSWASVTTANRVVGQVNAINSTDNNILFAGCQLEIGEQATPFEHRLFGDELQSCKRYYQTHGNEHTSYRYLAPGFCNSTSQAQGVLTLPVTMRAAPTASVSGNFEMIHGSTGHSITLGTKELNQSSVGLQPSGSSFTANSGAIIRASDDDTAELKLDAEM